MRKPLAVAVLTGALALGGWSAADADSIQLTGGYLSFELRDLGTAGFVGVGFEVDAAGVAGGWPVSVRPGDLVNFSTLVVIASGSGNANGQAMVNGMRLHGDPSGLGFLWITGSIHVEAVPFIAPPPSGFTGTFVTPVTLSGSLTGYFNSDVSQPPLFTETVFGNGIEVGIYRQIGSGSDSSYLDDVSGPIVHIFASTPSPTPEPATMFLFGAGMIGFAGRLAWRRRRHQ